jgi:hypothetical protein
MKIAAQLFLFVFLLGTSTLAAPLPGSSTSELVSPKLGLYRSPAGFQLTAGITDWAPSIPPQNNKFIETVYKPTKLSADKQGTLTVRVDSLKKDFAVDNYMKKWTKEYPRFGFDVLGSKPFKISGNQGQVVDLINRVKNRQLRQVVFVKDKKAVILTCRDQIGDFKDTLKSCNEIIKSFAWAKISPTK